MWTAVMLSVDDANVDIAGDWAERLGFLVLPHFPREPVPLKRYAAALVDLDHWDPQKRGLLLSYLSRKRLPRPVALFSYHLTPQEIQALQKNGVLVGRCLDRELLEQLARAVAGPHANGHPVVPPVAPVSAPSPKMAERPIPSLPLAPFREREGPTFLTKAEAS